MVNTHNGTERLNEDLKYDELVEYKNCTLSDLLSVVIYRFIPKLYEKYVELNARCTSSYKGYNRNISFYQHDRPKWIFDGMIEKLAKIQEEVKYAQIIKIQNNIQNNSDITSAGSKDKCQVDTCQTYDVQSLSAWTSEKETYRVDFGSNDRFCSCTCLSFRRKRVLCKHFFLVIENGYHSFTDVSQMYRNHPFIILDEEIFQGMNDNLNATGFTQLAGEGIKEHVSSDERQQEDPENISWEMTSSYAPLPSIGSNFKLKKMNLFSNIKMLTEKVYCIKNSHSSEDLIDAVNRSVLEVLTDVDRHLAERNDLFIELLKRTAKKRTEGKFQRKGKPKLH